MRAGRITGILLAAAAFCLEAAGSMRAQAATCGCADVSTLRRRYLEATAAIWALQEVLGYAPEGIKTTQVSRASAMDALVRRVRAGEYAEPPYSPQTGTPILSWTNQDCSTGYASGLAPCLAGVLQSREDFHAVKCRELRGLLDSLTSTQWFEKMTLRDWLAWEMRTYASEQDTIGLELSSLSKVYGCPGAVPVPSSVDVDAAIAAGLSTAELLRPAEFRFEPLAPDTSACGCADEDNLRRKEQEARVAIREIQDQMKKVPYGTMATASNYADFLSDVVLAIYHGSYTAPGPIRFSLPFQDRSSTGELNARLLFPSGTNDNCGEWIAGEMQTPCIVGLLRYRQQVVTADCRRQRSALGGDPPKPWVENTRLINLEIVEEAAYRREETFSDNALRNLGPPCGPRPAPAPLNLTGIGGLLRDSELVRLPAAALPP